jgi:hypothetical protein
MVRFSKESIEDVSFPDLSTQTSRHLSPFCHPHFRGEDKREIAFRTECPEIMQNDPSDFIAVYPILAQKGCVFKPQRLLG